METNDLIKNATKKLEGKNADLIVANNLRDKGAGFKTDTNVVTFIEKSGVSKLPILSKDEVAKRILDKLISMSEK